MGLGIDVEIHRVSLLAPGRTGQIFGSVGHNDLDRMIIGVNVLFHDGDPSGDKKSPQRLAGGGRFFVETKIFGFLAQDADPGK